MRWLMAIFFLILTASTGVAGKKSSSGAFLGRKAPEIIVEEWVTVKPQMKGKWLLVDFWTTWCSPCVRSIPELNRFHELFGEQMVVIGLSSEKRSTVERMKKPVINYCHGVDPQGRTKKAFGIKGIPHVVIIDPRGVVRWEGHPLLPGFKLTDEVIAGLLAKDRG